MTVIIFSFSLKRTCVLSKPLCIATRKKTSDANIGELVYVRPRVFISIAAYTRRPHTECLSISIPVLKASGIWMKETDTTLHCLALHASCLFLPGDAFGTFAPIGAGRSGLWVSLFGNLYYESVSLLVSEICIRNVSKSCLGSAVSSLTCWFVVRRKRICWPWRPCTEPWWIIRAWFCKRAIEVAVEVGWGVVCVWVRGGGGGGGGGTWKVCSPKTPYWEG